MKILFVTPQILTTFDLYMSPKVVNDRHNLAHISDVHAGQVETSYRAKNDTFAICAMWEKIKNRNLLLIAELMILTNL